MKPKCTEKYIDLMSDSYRSKMLHFFHLIFQICGMFHVSKKSLISCKVLSFKNMHNLPNLNAKINIIIIVWTLRPNSGSDSGSLSIQPMINSVFTEVLLLNLHLSFGFAVQYSWFFSYHTHNYFNFSIYTHCLTDFASSQGWISGIKMQHCWYLKHGKFLYQLDLERTPDFSTLLPALYF